MIRERLKEEQPLVYEALKNALENQAVSHAYLFAGPAGTMKKEAAFLLAMSLFCPQADGGFACESCSTCRRVLSEGHMDFIVLDGSVRSISKADVDSLQERFSRTSSEEGSGHRCCLILNAENCSVQAMNSMLKFLEEPGRDVTAVLTADNAGRLLPTIISRCTVLSFVRRSPELCFRQALEAGVPQEDAAFVSRLAPSASDYAAFAESGVYRSAVDMFRQFLSENGPFSEWLVDYDISYRRPAKDENLMMIRMFLDLVDLYAHDVIRKTQAGPAWYRRALQGAKGTASDYARLIIMVSRQKDLCTKYHDQNLLTAQIYEKLEEFCNELEKGN